MIKLVRLWGILCVGLVLGAAVVAGSDRPRLVLIKVDGLPPDLLAALSVPEREDYWERLRYAPDLRRAVRFYQEQTGRSILLPNIRQYFFQDGIYVENFYSETLTLSAAAWAVIDTGQPSVIKGHATFSRDTCYLRSHLDGYRELLDAIRHGEGKSTALWNLDQVGVSLMPDGFDPDRVWSGPQIFRRTANWVFVLESGKRWLDSNESGVARQVHSHLSRLVTGMDYTEFAQEMSGMVTARNLLEKDLLGEEKYDYLSPLFTLMDHQQHVDPHPENLIHWSVKLDREVGRIFEAVERSSRKSRTIVAMVSDHGSEIQPGKTAFSFPITKVFRRPLFGNHTVKTLLVESAWSAVSTPVPGVDFPRLYESPGSPYGGNAGGEEGYTTCFIDNFGNGRAAVNLRNDDLNRLHLILLEIKRSRPDSERWHRLKSMFRQNLERTRRWLEPDLALYQDYHQGAQNLAFNLISKTDADALDVARRLQEEVERDAPQIAALELLLGLRFENGDREGGLDFERIARSDFAISSLIPKNFLGHPNQVHQLSRYTQGLDEDLNWMTTTVDKKGRSLPMNYFEILSNFEAPNAPVNGDHNPYDLIVTRLPTRHVAGALQSAVGIDVNQRGLHNVVWVKSTARDRHDKGGEALIVEDADRRIQYVPVVGLEQAADLSFRFALGSGPDPLGLLAEKGVKVADDSSRLDWVRRFHSREEWLAATYQTEYGTAVCMLLDITGDPSQTFIDSPDFQRYLTHFSSPDLKARYLRGLKRKYAIQQPDFLVWSEELWNFNSKARTSGGSHSGLRPIVARTAFLAWGGDDTRLSRGKIISGVGTTLDVVPTLLQALGMLDEQNRLIPRPAAIPERVFLPFPGRVVDIFEQRPLEPNVAGGGPAGSIHDR